jgi:transposase-like protein
VKAVQRKKYSRAFKRAAVDRLVKGESATVIAGQLGIRRKFLYAWCDSGFGTDATGARQTLAESDQDPQQQVIIRQQEKIAELERLTGRQAAELDFFAAALRAVEESRPSRGTSSGSESTQRCKA